MTATKPARASPRRGRPATAPSSQLTTSPIGSPASAGATPSGRLPAATSGFAEPSDFQPEASDRSMIGRRIGRYRIVGRLGRGGMGAVWKAKDERLSRLVALKLLTEDLAVSTAARRRFIREARMASRLNHPGIAAIHDAGEMDGQLYIVTAFVDGCTLRDKLRAGPLPIPEAIRIACSVAEVLQHAHDHGVIHRDISGANIMVGPKGDVTVIDFGLARLRAGASSRLTPTGALIGTAPYVAPEVLKDHQVGPRADLYALGVVLYEMLAGAPPFEGQTFEALVYATLNQTPEAPSKRRPDVPARLDAVVLKALAKEPARRYPSASAMMRDLSGLQLPDRASDRAESPTAPRAGALRRDSRDRIAEPQAGRFLAVLPFTDTSPRRSRQAEVFARGLAETVSSRLAGVPGIHVIPPSALPTSSARELDVLALEREVGANVVLCGSVQRVGREIRIGFSLVGPRRVQIAGDTLDGSMRDILDLEDQLVRRIARSLELEPTSIPAPISGASPDPAAHERYLQALGYLQRYENEASVDGAIRLLEKLVESQGGARVHAVLGRAYLAKYLLTFETDWEERAAAACRTALKLDPNLPEVLVTLGNLHRQSGRYRTAVKDYGRALALRPDDAEALVELAWAHERAGQIQLAEKALQKAIALRPTFWRSHNHLGGFYYRQARYEKAAQCWQQVIELSPDNARGHSNLAAAYYHLGRYPEALAAYDRSVEIRPDASAYTSQGTVYFFLGDAPRAVQSLEKARALRPADPKVWGNLADAYRWTPGLEAKAGPAFDEAISLKKGQLDLNRKDGKGWAELAVWLAKRAKFREATQAIRRGLELSPHDVNCMALAVTAYHLVGDRPSALQWLKKAVRSGYDVAELERDPELAALRAEAAFQRIVKGRRANLSGT